ncbi:MAG: hypothetical protein ABJF04_22480 [Reichenbachiella sp.]|uniref:hypothetical protein n=1 Tax=Reichenbachiella sp. TaxID=2184521 RepID=UPI0032659CC1
MQLKNYFDINRFLKLLRLELFRSLRGIFIAFEITFGMLFFVGLLLSIILDDSMVFFEHGTGYAFTLIIGGFVLTSLSFNDLSDSLKSYSYLTLPASSFEKFLCMWLLTSIGWVVLYSFTYYIYTLAANPIGLMIDGNMKFENFDPLSEFAVSTMKYYFVLQGIFLVGAAHFKGYVFPKTVFVLILLAIVAGFLIYFSMADLLEEGEECLSEVSPLEGTTIYRIWLSAQWAFWWILAPLSWIIAYMGLKDREV